jgi:hypothetical protein
MFKDREDFMNQISRMADTGKQKINVTETKRVLAIALTELGALNVSDLAKVLYTKKTKSGA